ncbi:kazrin isoform X2 [Aplysia californica]|uniref:Kazrin isoform X2 n=1 Tax=Aplysia californica TaxID=6500 RepID=A0ABM1W1T2_APLCA|nr:kazrin isoform X2 [Aplysia californica]
MTSITTRQPPPTEMEVDPKAPSVGEKSTMKVSPSPRYNLGFLNELQSRHKFSMAVFKQNEVAATAIQSLDCLNDQIVQYIVSNQHPGPKDGVRVSGDSVHSSMVLIRRLLLDAQARFRKMVEDNKQLASHIDTSIQAANQEVNMLRAELASTNKRLSQISLQDDMGKIDACTQVDKKLLKDSPGEKSDSDKEDMEATVQTLASANEQLVEDYKHLLETHDILKCAHEELKNGHESMKTENSRLETQLRTLRKDLDDLRQVKVEGAAAEKKPSYGELKLELIQTRQELNRAKEVLQGMKSDRKRLKGEKLDLLSQMKQLYTTLEEKETELRDFIRNYEQRVKESDDMIKQLAKEKETLEHEKWDIITKAKDATERAMFLRAQLDTKDMHIKELQGELSEAKDQLSSQDSQVSSSTPPTTDDNLDSIMDDSIIIDDENGFSTMEESSVLNCSFSTPQLNTQGLSHSSPNNSDWNDPNGPLFKWFTQSSDFEIPVLEPKPSKKKKKTFGGSLSRVFSRGRMRRSIAAPHAESVIVEDTSSKLCVLSQENYQEKLSSIEHMVGVHMKDWRAHQVLAWLEITLAMPMYAQNCLLNVKSGRVLLGLSDSELSSALGVTNTMHRRKLRLAIEQHRNPNDIKYPKASEMDPTWVAHRFLPDLGLPQYTEVFEEQLCDGPILNTLTRRDLEKHFSVHRKFHQTSILHAIELLRRIDFNKEKLYHRRNLSEERDNDLIVWTNERLIKWTKSIDLGEYSENLVESGVNGAIMVLEPSFTPDTLSSALGIPPSKSYIRRHLATELESVLKPARSYQKGLKLLRAALDHSEPKVKTGENGAAGKQFMRGRKGSNDDGKNRLSFKGSLGRAFGKKVKDDLKLNFDTEPSKSKISAPIPIQHLSLSSLDTDSELMKKGFCLSNSLKEQKSPASQVTYRTSADHSESESHQSKSAKRKALAYSDQTLYKTALSELISKNESLNNIDHDVASNINKNVDVSQNLNNLNVVDRKEEKDKSSVPSSSQETLTEQSAGCSNNLEKNNNKKDKEASAQQKPINTNPQPTTTGAPTLVSSSVTFTSKPTMSSASATVVLEKKCAIKMEQPSVAFDKAVVTSKPPLRPTVSADPSMRSFSVEARSSQGDAAMKESMRKKRGSLKDVFPQTTSV